jgi:predicted nucleic acid-binding protein
MILVVDASAAGAILFDEPESATIRAHVRGETLVAPHLIDFELAGVCAKRMRRQPGEAERMLAMLQAFDHVPLRRVEVPSSDVARLAIRTGLSADDAAYLWLALDRDAELITLDRELARAERLLRGDPS